MRYLRKNKEKSLALTFTLKTNKDAFEVATEEVNCLTYFQKSRIVQISFSCYTAEKMKLSIKDFFYSHFTEEILGKRLIIWCSVTQNHSKY